MSGEILLRILCVWEAHGPLTAAEFAALFDCGRVLGLILHGEGRLCGLVEGEERQVIAWVDALVADPRFRGLRVLEEAPIAARRFSACVCEALPAGAGSDADLLALGRFLVSGARLA